jgi:hypothetical protein
MVSPLDGSSLVELACRKISRIVLGDVAIFRRLISLFAAIPAPFGSL